MHMLVLAQNTSSTNARDECSIFGVVSCSSISRYNGNQKLSQNLVYLDSSDSNCCFSSDVCVGWLVRLLGCWIVHVSSFLAESSQLHTAANCW